MPRLAPRTIYAYASGLLAVAARLRSASLHYGSWGFVFGYFKRKKKRQKKKRKKKNSAANVYAISENGAPHFFFRFFFRRF